MGDLFHIEREKASEEELRIAKRCAPHNSRVFVRLQAIEEPYRGRSPKVATPLRGMALFMGQRSLSSPVAIVVGQLITSSINQGY